MNFGGPEGPVSQIHSPYSHVRAPGVCSDLLRSFQMLERERERESGVRIAKGTLIPGETAAWIPEFVVEDLPLNSTAVLVPEFALEGLPLVRTL